MRSLWLWAVLLAVLLVSACGASGSKAPTPIPVSDPAQQVEVLRQRADAQRQAGDYAAAAETLQALTALAPADAALRYELGLLLAATEPEAAVPHLVQAAELDPAQRQAAGSIAASIRSAAIQNDLAYLLLESGRALAAQGEWSLAGEAFRRATSARPDYAEAWAFLGEALQHGEQNNPSAALQALQKALALDPASLVANSLLALYWQRQQDFPRALEILENTATTHPDNPAVLVELGKARAQTGDLAGGLAAHQQAIDLAPGDPQNYRLLAEFCMTYELQLADLALPAARQAVALDLDSPASLATLGKVLLLLGDLDNAERMLLRALQNDSAFTPAITQLGLVYALQGDPERARVHWQSVIELAPGTPAAQQAQRLLQNYFP